MGDHQQLVDNQHGPIESGEVNLIGVLGGEVFGREARSALRRATLIAGAPTHLSSVAVPACVRTLPLGADLQKFVASLEQVASSGENVCVLCSGDPGFFGLARLASQLISPSLMHVYPAPSSVSVAFARVGTNWDDAVVISAHGRRGGAEAAARAIARSLKVAVLCGPEAPPHLLGRLALNQGASAREILVGTSLCELGESVWSGDLEGLASGTFDPASVVVSIAARARRAPRITQGVPSSLEVAARPDRPAAPDAAAPDPAAPDPGPANLRWGRPENEFAHVRGMVTKAEVRAIAISKLDLPATGVMWDVGAGSGSVSIECAALAPGLSVHAIERDPNQLEVLHANASGTRVTLHAGEAPEAFDSLDDPDRVFVGGGGIGVLDAVLARLRPGGKVVAVYAAPERALAGARRLGGMAQVSISRAVPVGSDKTLRLQAENPVFVCWGPAPIDGDPK